jgi:uncharacterized protein (DUF1684 family)
MKYILISLVVFLIVLSCSSQKKDLVIEEIKDFQHKLNVEYADIKTSPLTEDDVITFSSLDFYPIDKKYYVKAKFIRTPDEKLFNMLTTTSRLSKYVKYGEASFEIEDKKLKLDIYQSLSLKKKPKYKDYLFLPFTDNTSGKESYEGGRYIDLKIPKGDTIIIDFNKAYNPYCAYNYKYSCPIPPKGNHLDIAIKAGVKKYKK